MPMLDAQVDEQVMGPVAEVHADVRDVLQLLLVRELQGELVRLEGAFSGLGEPFRREHGERCDSRAQKEPAVRLAQRQCVLVSCHPPLR
jgi:hypothetical protein